LKTQEIELDIEGDGTHGSIRDMHYHVSKDCQVKNKYLAILYVENDEITRKYNMKQFLFTNDSDLKCTPFRVLFSNSDDSVNSSKPEQRREFYWWAQFRCLGKDQFAFLFDEEGGEEK
jgi:hypothetical protein